VLKQFQQSLEAVENEGCRGARAFRAGEIEEAHGYSRDRKFRRVAHWHLSGLKRDAQVGTLVHISVLPPQAQHRGTYFFDKLDKSLLSERCNGATMCCLFHSPGIIFFPLSQNFNIS
jgi:hypothetical protein